MLVGAAVATAAAVGAGASVTFAAWHSGRLLSSGQTVRSRRRALAFVTAGVLLLVGGWKVSLPSIAVAGPMLVGITAAEQNRRERLLRAVAVDEQLPAFVDAMIQGLRSGVGLQSLCTRPPSVAPEVDAMAEPMAAALAGGQSLVDATSRFGIETAGGQGAGPDDGVRLVAAALGVVAERGGPAVPALQRLRLTLTGLTNGRAEARARSGQALASARLLTVAPAVFALLLATFDDDLADLYLHKPAGAICIGACIVLTYSGWRWMNRIVDRVAP